MLEVQCPSCQTRYRIDESVLPQDSPTFKCSRCGHVFSGDPRVKRTPAAPRPRPAPAAAGPSAPRQQNSPTSAAPPTDQPRTQPQPGRPAGPRSDAAPWPAQRTGSSADLHVGPPTAAPPPRSAPSADLHGAPTAPRQTSPAAAPRPPLEQPRPAASERTARSAAHQPDNPLARSFAEDEPHAPENLSFDFGDDETEQHDLGEPPPSAQADDRYERWRVGDDAEEATPPPITPEMGRYRARRAALVQQASRRVDRAAVAAETAGHERPRSSGFFLGLFVIIVLFFALVTFVLGISPSLSRELLAQLPVIGDKFVAAAPHQNLVALSDVHAEYRRLDANRRALIISGRAENRGAEALHTIEVGVSLVDSQQHPVVSQSVFCGDLVSPKIVSQMTPHELQFFQKLAPPKNFALKSGDSSPFFVMFINPPPNVANFQVAVLKTEVANAEAMAAGS